VGQEKTNGPEEGFLRLLGQLFDGPTRHLPVSLVLVAMRLPAPLPELVCGRSIFEFFFRRHADACGRTEFIEF
jgi:hypothetical protein